uniref:DNA topoisomerase (ATP-hydrolyzing) n=1 Tax=Aegilops tauschii subsp. strangulata TaxID=200361 RepID=A0A453D800_AEGTS
MLEFFEKKLKQVDNRARFLSCVLSGDIKIIPRKQKELLQEIAEKGFDPLPKEVLPAAVGATGDSEENGRSSDVLHASDYEYLTSMTISTLNEGYLEHLLVLKKRFETKVGLLRRTTPECRKSEKEPTISPDIQFLDANYIKAQSDRKVVIVIDCKHNNVFEAAPRRQHKRTAAEYLEASVVLMDDDEDHLAGSLEAQEFSGKAHVHCCICRNNIISCRSSNGHLLLLAHRLRTHKSNKQRSRGNKERSRGRKKAKQAQYLAMD